MERRRRRDGKKDTVRVVTARVGWAKRRADQGELGEKTGAKGGKVER